MWKIAWGAQCAPPFVTQSLGHSGHSVIHYTSIFNMLTNTRTHNIRTYRSASQTKIREIALTALSLSRYPWGSPAPRWGRGWSAPPAPSPWRPPHRSRGSDGCRVQCWRLLARVSPAPGVMGHGSIYILYFFVFPILPFTINDIIFPLSYFIHLAIFKSCQI